MRARSSSPRLPATASLLALLAIILGACGSSGEQSSTTSTAPATTTSVAGDASLDLVIGDSLPLSGRLQEFGPAGKKAARLALETIEDAIDRTDADDSVELVHTDNGGGSDQEQAIASTRELVGEDRASCIAGPWASADVIQAAESVTIGAGVPLISPAAGSDEITELDDDGLVMRTVRPESAQGAGLAAYVSDELGGAKGKTVNIGARNDAYGDGIADSFTAAWKKLGGKIGTSELYEVGLPDPKTTAEAIVGDDPDAVVVADFPVGFAKLAPALKRTGDYDPSQTFVADGLVDKNLAKLAGEQAVDGLRGVAVGVPEDKPATRAFDKAFTKADPPGVERITFDAQNFDAVVLCYLGAVAAGSTDGAAIAAAIPDVSAPGGRLYSWEQLPQAIEALRSGRQIDYQGASGAINLDDAGDATAGIYDVFEFKDGKPSQIDQVYSAASAQPAK